MATDTGDLPRRFPRNVAAGDLSGFHIGRRMRIPGMLINIPPGYLSDYEAITHETTGKITWIRLYLGGNIYPVTPNTIVEIMS